MKGCLSAINIRITPAAKQLFIDYMTTHKKARRYETKCSGVRNILKNVERYFQIELYETEHKKVVQMIKASKGVFTKKAMETWIYQNWYEIYQMDKSDCSD